LLRGTSQQRRVRGGDPELDEYLHLYTVNSGVLLTPFHNMALMCPATTAADVDAHTELVADAGDLLAGLDWPAGRSCQVRAEVRAGAPPPGATPVAISHWPRIAFDELSHANTVAIGSCGIVISYFVSLYRRQAAGRSEPAGYGDIGAGDERRLW
jgi:hypothetical protein